MEDKFGAGSTTNVSIESPGGGITELTDRPAIEEALLANNRRKYHQTEGACEFHSAQSVEVLGTCGDGPRVIDILEDRFPIPSFYSDATREFIQACRRDPSVFKGEDPIPARFSAFRASWRHRKEKTVSANQHIGHFKAAMRDDDLCWLLFQRSEIPSFFGYSPIRHRKCVDLIINKKDNSPLLKRKRTLGLLDSEFNHSNSSFGRESMMAALHLKKLATEQFCRPGRSAMDSSVMQRCTLDHFQYRRQCFALTSCDLANCYDRIVHTAAALALLRLGVSHTKICSMFHSIQKIIHRVRTAFGDSEQTYGGDDLLAEECPPQGVLQGNAAGPTIWSIISSVIFDCLHARGHSIFFCSSISRQLFALVGFM